MTLFSFISASSWQYDILVEAFLRDYFTFCVFETVRAPGALKKSPEVYFLFCFTAYEHLC